MAGTSAHQAILYLDSQIVIATDEVELAATCFEGCRVDDQFSELVTSVV